MSELKITIQPEGRQVGACEGELLRDVLLREKILIAFPCGGAGICGKCRVRVLAGGDEPDHTEQETLGRELLGKGVRLACRVNVLGDMTVEFIEQVVEEQILEVGSERGVVFDPFIKAETVTVPEPELEDPIPDAERLFNLTGKRIKKLGVFRKLPGLLRESGHRLEIVYREDEIIDLRAPGVGGLYSIGVDIGTTTVAVTLVDMQNGRHIHSASVKNPQEPFGSDVISRIQYVSKNDEHLKELSGLIHAAIDTLVGELCETAGVRRNEIYDIVVVGNTVMNHLFLGVDPAFIAQSPYVPAHSQGIAINAVQAEIGINPNGEIFTGPNIAGFVGGDTVAGILDGGMLDADKPLLLVDIGTNGEVALGDKNGLYACSTAAGPAFEGVNLRHGMRAGKGAIERLAFEGGTISWRTIGNDVPRGICGSGIIDAVALMVNEGIIEPSGRFADPDQVDAGLAARIGAGDNGEPEFILVPAEESGTDGPIAVTQKDIRELQLAKGAIAAGIQILLDKAGLKAEEVDGLLLAGAFGNYIRKEAALAIGLFPGFSHDQIRFIGNAAGYGAVMMLLSRAELERGSSIRENCEYVEVGALPDFQNYFADNMIFEDAQHSQSSS